MVATSLVKRRSRSVALLISHTRNPIFPEIAAGVEEALGAGATRPDETLTAGS
jgi:DNA-binding LacI/PurR family transcriptional regulator